MMVNQPSHSLPQPVAETTPRVPDAGAAKRVLVIDDEATIRIALRRFFTRLGWSVDEASNGENALAMLLDDAKQSANPGYSIVISDLRMPGLNGIELHDRLMIECPDVLPRIIFSTGDTVSEEAAAFVRDTSCVVLPKPFELSTLRATVEKLLCDDR